MAQAAPLPDPDHLTRPTDEDEDGATRPPAEGDGAEPRPLAVGATIAALLVALASSLWQMTRKPLWNDEAFSLGATNQLVDTITGTGGTMASYYVLLNAWVPVFGTSRMGLRSLSLVLCLLAVALLALLARRVLRPIEASVAVLVTAALPGLVRMAQDARAYPLLLVLATAGWLVLAQLVGSESSDPGGRAGWRWSLALVPIAVLGQLGQGLFALQVAAMGLSVLVHPRRRALVVRLLPTTAALAATIGVLLTLGAADVGDWIPPLSWSQARPYVDLLLGFHGWATAGLGALAVGGAVALVRDRTGSPFRRWATLVPVWWGLGPTVLLLALSTARPSFLSRYVLASLPGVGMLIAVGAVRAGIWALGHLTSSRTSPKRLRTARIAVTAAVASALVLALVAGRLSRTWSTYEGWDRAAQLVAAEARPGDGIIFTFPEDLDRAMKDSARAPFEAAWREVSPRATPVALSPARPLGQVRRFDDHLPDDELSPKLLAHDRVWVVQAGGFDISLQRLLDTPPARGAFRRALTSDLGNGVQVVLLEQV